MPVPTIPDFRGSPYPLLSHVRAAEQALLGSLGGIYGSTFYPGNLDYTNFGTSGLGIPNAQRKEPRAITCLAPTYIYQGFDGGLSVSAPPPSAYAGYSVAGPNARWQTQVDCVVERLVYTHARPTRITEADDLRGLILVNDKIVQEIQYPDPGGMIVLSPEGWLAGEPYEWPLDLGLRAGDWVDLLWLATSAPNPNSPFNALLQLVSPYGVYADVALLFATVEHR